MARGGAFYVEVRSRFSCLGLTTVDTNAYDGGVGHVQWLGEDGNSLDPQPEIAFVNCGFFTGVAYFGPTGGISVSSNTEMFSTLSARRVRELAVFEPVRQPPHQSGHTSLYLRHQ